MHPHDLFYNWSLHLLTPFTYFTPPTLTTNVRWRDGIHLKLIQCYVPIKPGVGREKTQRRPCADGGRDWNDATTAKDRLEPPETGRGRKDPPLESWEEAQPCWHLNLGFLASKAVREQISVVLSHQVCTFSIWQPQETNTPLRTFFFYHLHLSSMRRRAMSLFWCLAHSGYLIYSYIKWCINTSGKLPWLVYNIHKEVICECNLVYKN